MIIYCFGLQAISEICNKLCSVNFVGNTSFLPPAPKGEQGRSPSGDLGVF